MSDDTPLAPLAHARANRLTDPYREARRPREKKKKKKIDRNERKRRGSIDRKRKEKKRYIRLKRGKDWTGHGKNKAAKSAQFKRRKRSGGREKSFVVRCPRACMYAKCPSATTCPFFPPSRILLPKKERSPLGNEKNPITARVLQP